MAIQFNADEIFAIAEHIERNGAAFYRRAAEGTGSAPIRQALLDLAAAEAEHEATFTALRKELSGREVEQPVLDPDAEAALYLQAFADGKVFDVKADPAAQLTGQERPAEILQTAIGLEKDSIVFYVGMRDMVPARLGKDRVDDILREEMRHVTSLAEQLKAAEAA